jgi:hypothetical protein
MELEDKKFLAEWMGWKKYPFSKNSKQDCLDSAHKKQNGKCIYLKTWNPDTCHKAFTEVWDRLTQSQKLRALGYCVRKEGKYPVVELLHVLTAISNILNNLPKVMEKVLEVLKGGE